MLDLQEGEEEREGELHAPIFVEDEERIRVQRILLREAVDATAEKPREAEVYVLLAGKSVHVWRKDRQEQKG